MKLLEESVTDAAKNVVEELRKDGGIGGVIALDEKGTRECSSLQLQMF
jgi:beta-aspartyl-peptidase (threonine type)